MFYFPGLGDLQPYETWKPEFALRVLPECFRIVSGFAQSTISPFTVQIVWVNDTHKKTGV